MTNILTATEAANVLRVDPNDSVMLDLLAGVDAYIEQATGRDWAVDSTIYPEAKSAARMLLVMWYENPAMVGDVSSLSFGLRAVLTQLEALAMKLETEGIPDEALALVAAFPVDGQDEVSILATMTLVFNHEMHADSPDAVTLIDAAGSTVASTNTLNATSKIIKVTPDGNLTAGVRYRLVIDAAADAYGATLSDEIAFTTAD